MGFFEKMLLATKLGDVIELAKVKRQVRRLEAAVDVLQEELDERDTNDDELNESVDEVRQLNEQVNHLESALRERDQQLGLRIQEMYKAERRALDAEAKVAALLDTTRTDNMVAFVVKVRDACVRVVPFEKPDGLGNTGRLLDGPTCEATLRMIRNEAVALLKGTPVEGDGLPKDMKLQPEGRRR